MPHLVVERSPDPGGRLSPGRRLWITGHVQGVGFRPFLYRLANHHGLAGWARNTVGEVEVLICGQPGALDDFTRDVIAAAPAIAAPRLRRIENWQGPLPERFEILASAAGATPRIFVPPDYFTCDDCLGELADPGDRRYRYPFINCTQCGPRYTLIEALPYDRANTSMAGFPLCPACAEEYADPANRRFHAEPIACPDCGPQLRWTTVPGTSMGSPARNAAWRATQRLSSPAWLPQPTMTSSMALPSSVARDMSGRITSASRSSGRMPDSAPPERPKGLRRPS